MYNILLKNIPYYILCVAIECLLLRLATISSHVMSYLNNNNNNKTVLNPS